MIQKLVSFVVLLVTDLVLLALVALFVTHFFRVFLA